MVFTQNRKGPDIVGFIEQFQHLCDGLKLFYEEQVSPSNAKYTNILFSLLAWASIPYDIGIVSSYQI